MKYLKDPKFMTAFHGWAAIAWGILSILTAIAAMMWAEHPALMAWVIFMSGYANFSTHWSARQGAESEAADGMSDEMRKAITEAVAQGLQVRGTQGR